MDVGDLDWKSERCSCEVRNLVTRMLLLLLNHILYSVYSVLVVVVVQMATIKKNLRLFNGFPFDADSEQYSRKREKLLK